MTKIKIFLASSLELKTDREQFEILIHRKNKELRGRNIFLDLELWEDFSMRCPPVACKANTTKL